MIENIIEEKTVCMKIFCEDLKDQTMKIINYEKKEMIIRKFVTYVKKNFVQMKIIKKNLKKCRKSEIIVITQENIEELLIVIVI